MPLRWLAPHRQPETQTNSVRSRVMDWHRLRFDSRGAFTDPATGRRLGTYARPFMSTPAATGDLLAALIDAHPDVDVATLRRYVHFDPELQQVLDQFMADGWGHLMPEVIFRM
ncbi:hypothetical protein BAB79_16630 [Mycobacteroides abscessus]|nr:hypothetical protein A3O06_16630 [Mycobacteroides abscessus]ANO24951.1 hypothetical protein BAB79_16630 [Mycobacteroides abscessus]